MSALKAQLAKRRAKERKKAAQAELSRNKKPRPPEQFPSAFPDAPEAYSGIARTLSRGITDG